MILFLTPIFYFIKTMPKANQWLSYPNQFYIIAEGYRQPLIYNTVSPTLLAGLAYVFVLSSVLYYFGLKSFRRVKGYFDSAL